MNWTRINDNVIESKPDGKFRIVKSEKGFTAWMKNLPSKHREKEWVRLQEPFKTPEEARRECELNQGDDHASCKTFTEPKTTESDETPVQE